MTAGTVTLPDEVVQLAQAALDAVANLPLNYTPEQLGTAMGKAAGAAMRLRLWVRDAQRERDAEVMWALQKLLEKSSSEYWPIEQEIARAAIAKATGSAS